MNVQGHFFVVFTGADYNRLQDNKIAKFTVYVRGSGEGGGSRGEELTLSFERLRGEWATKIKHVRTRGKGDPNFGYFMIT